MFEIDQIEVEEATKPYLRRKFKMITRPLWWCHTAANRKLHSQRKFPPPPFFFLNGDNFLCWNLKITFLAVIFYVWDNNSFNNTRHFIFRKIVFLKKVNHWLIESGRSRAQKRKAQMKRLHRLGMKRTTVNSLPMKRMVRLPHKTRSYIRTVLANLL